MPATRLRCTECSSIFTVTVRSVVGTEVQCSQCQHRFEARSQDVQMNAPAPTSAKRPPAPPMPKPPTPTKSIRVEAPETSSARNKALFVGAAIAVGALMVGGFFLVNASEPPPPPKAAKLIDPDSFAIVYPKRKPIPPTPVLGIPPEPPKTIPVSKPTPPPPKFAAVSPELQAKINNAIKKGVKSLRSYRNVERMTYGTGLLAFRGLTLLECGVPASDPMIQQTVKLVRQRIPKETMTYQIALIILFLDKLGELEDRRRIESLALQLIASQTPLGGWSYYCPKLTPGDEEQLYARLREEQPNSPLQVLELVNDDEIRPFMGTTARAPSTSVKGATNEELKKLSKDQLPLFDREPPLKKIPEKLKRVPGINPVPKIKDLPTRDRSDNSNTQFAILGLWAARRYGVPMDRPLALIVKRFQKSLNHDGTWGYHFTPPARSGGRATMTCAGLLGLAVAHGMVADALPAEKRGKVKLRDPAISKGMKAVANYLKRANFWRSPGGHPFYLYWSIERVGVLYGKRKFGESDWYEAGARHLVSIQGREGGWDGDRRNRGYRGIVDSCFALLFLKRANLTQDLTENLESFLNE